MITKVAIKHDAALVDGSGHVVGHDAGSTLVRRLLRVFPGSELIGPGPRRCAGFDLIPLEFVDPVNTVVISMDVLDSVDVWRTDDRLMIQVRDDGRGGADVSGGSGLAGLAERLDSVDGLFVVASPAGGPTVVTAELPWRDREQ